MKIFIVELSNGESVGLGALEITTIPHISILQKRYSTTPNIHTEYKQDMARLLSEIFQTYKLNFSKHGRFKDISLEFLWCTEEVKNQPHKASISLFLIIRAIDDTKEEIENTLSSLFRISQATLDFGKYEYRSESFENLSQRIRKINDESINGLVKEERIENLQNQILPSCFSFDRLPVTENDLSRIVNALIDHPNSAVSFQLMPSTYSAGEMDVIGKMTQALDTLNKGIMEQGVGNISFALAEKHAEVYKYYSKNKNAALFTFNILVFGSSHAVNAISTKIFGQLNISNELRLIPLMPNDVKKDDNFYPLPWAVNELLLGTPKGTQMFGAPVKPLMRIIVYPILLLQRRPLNSSGFRSAMKMCPQALQSTNQARQAAPIRETSSAAAILRSAP